MTRGSIPRPVSSDQLVYTRHALDQMAARDVSVEEVRQVADRPDMNLPSAHARGKRRLVRTIKGRKISVILGPSGIALNTVVTVWWE